MGAGLAAASMIPLAGRGLGQVAAAGTPDVSGAASLVMGAASLGAHAAARGLLYGCAVDVHALGAEPAYAALIRQQCNIVVAENAMKWAALRPSAETFRFDDADALMTFAEANRMKVRGHNLAWHEWNPKWLETDVTAANARQVLVTHIRTVVGRYAGRIHSWDVVNEAIDVKDGRPDGLRSSVWLRLIGDDYLELAFRTAREADAKALLTYNDYGFEAETAEAEQKRAAVLGLLRRLVGRGVPIDAVGVQSHIDAVSDKAPKYGAGLAGFIAAARELGLQVFVTEMDVNDRAVVADTKVRDAAVAGAYKQYLGLALADPAVRAVLTWGITDRHTWLDHAATRSDGQTERPLPFDSDYHAKAAFFAVRDALDARDEKGRVQTG
jgi:endo-1,4-beta-xylanase